MADKKPIKDTPQTETPVIFTGLELGKPKKTAAGIPAVISSVKHVVSEVGVLRGMKVLNQLNQMGGVDCPGCAWPDPDDERSKLGEYCENGAKAIAEEATAKSLKPDFFRKNSVVALSMLSDYEIGKKGRIGQPMYMPKGSDYYEEISWDKAFNIIGEHLKNLDNPNEAIFYTSGRTSNEAAFLYQLFVREYGTNNLPDCSNMCHESSGAALSETVGIGKGSVKLEDFYETEVIMVLGQNPGTNHPRMLTALEKAKENGAKIITINPIIEPGLLKFDNPQKVKGILGLGQELTDLYLQVKINGDMALIQAIVQMLLHYEDKYSSKIIDQKFMDEKTKGHQEYINHIRSLDINTLSEACGISLDQIAKAAKILAENNKIIACWAMGLTQHKNSVDTIKELVNLLLIKGSIGKPGTGTCPVRGHSNVQGDRTMGIYEKPPKVLLDNLEKLYSFMPPRDYGYDTVDSIKAMYEGRAKIFFGMGGNFLSASPDTIYTGKALSNCKLTVHVSTKLNRSHLVHGEEALILPCLGRTDKDMKNGHNRMVSVENSMGIIHSSQGVINPISDLLLSEPEIVCQLAQATLPNSKTQWMEYADDYNLIRDDIEKCIPGFDDYNERIRIPGGFYLPNGARIMEFHTDSGKAHFTVSHIDPIKINSDELIMMTIRSHDQFNTTIYGLDDRYRGIYNERRVILMNSKDIKKWGLKEKDVVDLFNYHDDVERVGRKFIVIEYQIPQGCVATYFPEANVLVPINSTAKKSNTPTSKSVIIKLKKREEVI